MRENFFIFMSIDNLRDNNFLILFFKLTVWKYVMSLPNLLFFLFLSLFPFVCPAAYVMALFSSKKS